MNSKKNDIENDRRPLLPNRLEISDLELETLIEQSDPPSVKRTNSGTRLLSRSNSSTTRLRNFSVLESCEDRGQRIAHAAISRTRSATRRAFRRPTMPCGLLSIIGMVLMSLFINGFEGSYITELFGSTEDKVSFREPKDSTKEENSVSSQDNLPPIPVTSVPRSLPPTASPSVKVPDISIHEHKRIAANNSEIHAHNSFSSWLDFDDSDPPPSQKLPRPSDPHKFVDAWCQLDKTTWQLDTDNWRRRAPSFLLPGALFSGTVYLAAALHDHPSVAKARAVELNFFLDRQFRRYVNQRSEKTLVWAARKRMYANQFPEQKALEQNASVVSFDASPSYLFYSTLTPRRIMCVEPWIKLVFLLRNPVDRVLEHYAYMKQKHNIKATLDEVIDEDMDLMSHIGLLNSTGKNNTLEDNRWLDYQFSSRSGILGRSLYYIQVRHWVQALRAAGRHPHKSILMIRTDVLAADPAAAYQRVLEFVDLAPHPLTREPPLVITHQTRSVANTTRKRLEDFYRPYNKLLKQLMRQHGLKADL